jgi:hypothetical protein
MHVDGSSASAYRIPCVGREFLWRARHRRVLLPGRAAVQAGLDQYVVT